MKKYIIVIMMAILLISSTSYADITDTQKTKIESELDVIIENIGENITSYDNKVEKNAFVIRLANKLEYLETIYAKKSESYEYIFNYLITQLDTSYDIFSAYEYYGSGLSQQQIQNIIDTHNLYRVEVGISDLIWSDEVAKSAEKWGKVLEVEGCGFRHSNSDFRNNYGENLYTYWSSRSNSDVDNSISAIQSLGDEKYDYNYGTNTCEPGKICGHYTQMVWQDTTQLGCARIECRDNGYKEVYICQYNPAGNYIGEKPY